MATDASARPAGRPRPWLLISLVVAVLFAAFQWWPTKPAEPSRAPSNARQAAKTPEAVDPSDLSVRLDELEGARPDAAGIVRNPFRFQPKPPPPPPPAPPVLERPVQPSEVAPGPPQPTPPAPIPLKFIGTVEPTPGDRVAAFSDCRYTFRGREGEIVDGRYRLVRIGVESVVMEYVDGRGRMTIRLTGQECVGK